MRLPFGTMVVGGILGCSGPTEPELSPATLHLRLTVSGMATDGMSHTVTISDTTGVTLATLNFPYQGGDTVLTGLTAGDYRIVLDSPLETCIPISSTPWVISLRPNDDRFAELQASCYGAPAQVFIRTARNYAGASERFVLMPDNRFLYQIWGLGWTGKLPGHYQVRESRLLFSFEADAGRWEATGTLDNNCLRIEFNDIMILSDFENGTFCLGSVP